MWFVLIRCKGFETWDVCGVGHPTKEGAQTAAEALLGDHMEDTILVTKAHFRAQRVTEMVAIS